MKQTILALGAAAALGFAGTANAIVFFGSGDDASRAEGTATMDVTGALAPNSWPNVYDYGTPATGETAISPATTLRQHAGGTGHMLFAPYYNVQAGTASMFNIINTDTVNGKAVKVRLRGGSNSDDVLDFIVLLSPRDMWTATLYRDGSNRPRIITRDNSCTIPAAATLNSTPLSTARVAAIGAQQATLDSLISEGYIEVLNMADIPPTQPKAAGTLSPQIPNGLYNQILHVGNPAAPTGCAAADMALSGDPTTGPQPVNLAGVTAAGLASPTGGLSGSWFLLNQGQASTYSGNMTAIRAEDANGENGYGAILFSPQLPDPVSGIGKTALTDWDLTSYTTAQGVFAADKVAVAGLTADPLMNVMDDIDPNTGLAKGTWTKDPIITPSWFDLPDMSTPLLTAISTPQDQVMSLGLAHMRIYNEYLAQPDMTPGMVPMTTDWIVSQPTRRYYVAVDYAGKQLYWNLTMGTEVAMALAAGGSMHQLGNGPRVTGEASDNAYRGIAYLDRPFAGEQVPYACLNGLSLMSFDREEQATSIGSGSVPSPLPATPLQFCGEVFAISYTPQSVMNAQVGRIDLTAAGIQLPGVEGWSFLAFGRRLPVVGFAATQYINLDIPGRNYGTTWPHRWDH